MKTVMTKNEAINAIEKLPEGATIKQMIEALQIRERNLQAMASIEAGRGVPQEEVDKIVDQWLEE